jgi:hypothetical protein
VLDVVSITPSRRSVAAGLVAPSLGGHQSAPHTGRNDAGLATYVQGLCVGHEDDARQRGIARQAANALRVKHRAFVELADRPLLPSEGWEIDQDREVWLFRSADRHIAVIEMGATKIDEGVGSSLGG